MWTSRSPFGDSGVRDGVRVAARAMVMVTVTLTVNMLSVEARVMAMGAILVMLSVEARVSTWVPL